MTKRIGTHNGKFHADEALACFLLFQTKTFEGAEIVRTRDPKLLAEMDIVVDVGGEYDPARERYDHHQKGFEEVFSENYETKLSSAGLIYKHYGKEVLKSMLMVEDSVVEYLHDKIYKDIIESFDGHDNGISRYPADLKPKYKEAGTIGSRVNRLNPWWNSPDFDDSAAADKCFLKAVELVGEEFSQVVNYVGKAWLPARDIVKQALENNYEDGILVLPRSCPWGEHLYDLEESMKLEVEPKYCIYPDGTSGQWRIQAVSIRDGSFTSRCPLPEAWRGIRDSQLDKLVADSAFACEDVKTSEGCVFVHATGFIGGHKTKEGALAMAKIAIALGK